MNCPHCDGYCTEVEIDDVEDESYEIVSGWCAHCNKFVSYSREVKMDD